MRDDGTHRRRGKTARLALSLFCCAAGTVTASPLSEDDNGPLTGGFGLPGVEEGGVLTGPGQFRPGLSVVTSSHAIVEMAGNEELILDGESIRAILDLRMGLRRGIEIGAEIPWVDHQRGGLDALIDTWHDIFQLPDGSRDDRPRDQLEFSYSDAAGQRLDFTDAARGLGDIRLFAGFDLKSTRGHRRALRLSVKLPTGNPDKLLGSGGTDISAGIAGDLQHLGHDGKMTAFYRANITYLGEPDLLADRYEDLVAQVSGGFGYRLTERIELNAQSTLRTAVYESEVEKLGEMALTLTFGGHIRLNRLLVLSLGVTEDIKVNSAPDVSFNIGLRYRPRR